MMFWKTAAVAALSALILNGCATSGSDGNVDPRLTDESANFFSESGWTACGIGAVVGLGACLALADSDKRLTCAAIALPAGCGLFMGGNYLLDDLRVHYKTKEEQLDKMTEYVAADNKKVRTMIEQTKAIAKEDEEKLAQLDSQITQGKITQDDIRMQQADMESNYKFMQKSLSELDSRLSKYTAARNDIVNDTGNYASGSKRLTRSEQAELEELDKEIAALQRSRAELEAQMQSYAQTRNAWGVKVS